MNVPLILKVWSVKLRTKFRTLIISHTKEIEISFLQLVQFYRLAYVLEITVQIKNKNFGLESCVDENCGHITVTDKNVKFLG